MESHSQEPIDESPESESDLHAELDNATTEHLVNPLCKSVAEHIASPKHELDRMEVCTRAYSFYLLHVKRIAQKYMKHPGNPAAVLKVLQNELRKYTNLPAEKIRSALDSSVEKSGVELDAAALAFDRTLFEIVDTGRFRDQLFMSLLAESVAETVHRKKVCAKISTDIREITSDLRQQIR